MAEQRYSLQAPLTTLSQLYPHDVVEVKLGHDAKHTLFVRKNRLLLIYEPNDTASTSDNGGWAEAHQAPDFFSVGEKHPNYPWEVYERGLVVVRNKIGLEIFQWSNHTLTRLFSQPKFNDAFGYGAPDSTFLLGNIFPVEKSLGIVTRLKSDVQFHSIDLDSGDYKLKALKLDQPVGAAWTNQSASLSIVENVTSGRQSTIALRTVSELNLFRLDGQYALQELTTVHEFPPLDGEYDRILFARFGNETPYNDMLHFSTEGLTLYGYNETEPAYQKRFYSTTFSKLRGWNRRMISTIAVLDVAGDSGTAALIYSGPTGLSVTRATTGDLGIELISALDDVVNNQAVCYALPKYTHWKGDSSGGMEMFLHTPNGLERAELTTYNVQPEQTAMDKPVSGETTNATEPPNRNKIIPEIVAHGSRTLWLHDQLDLASLLQPFNPHTGSVELTLPLIDLRKPFGVPIRKLFQYKNMDYSNELGRGWSFPLDYITIDRYESAFEQDHVYSLIKDNQQIIMNRVYEQKQNDTSNATSATAHENIIRFTIDGYPDIKILYDGSESQWLLTIDKRTLVYTTVAWFMTNEVCSRWPLCGSASTDIRSLPSRWYLNREEDDAGWDAKYFYKIVKDGSDIRLQTIALHDNSTVQLSYEHDRITALQISTIKYRQDVRFHYHPSEDKLVRISQEGQSLFEFGYDTMHRLSKIVYPNGIEWTPQYQQVTIDPAALQKRIDVDGDAMVYYGPDYVVVVDAHLADGLLTLHIRDPLGGLGTGASKTNTTETVRALEDIKRYMVHAIADLIVVTIIYAASKDVAVLQFTEGDGWRQREYYDALSLDSTVHAGNTFALLADTKTLRLLSVSAGQLTATVVRSELPRDFVVHAFPHGYATYDGRMRIFILNNSGKWLSIVAKEEKNFFTQLDDFLNAFELKAELRESIRRGLMADMLGNFRQDIVLKFPYRRAAVVKIAARFYSPVVSATPRMHDYYTTYVPYTDLGTFNYTVSTKDKDVFVLGYELKDNKYHLKVKSSTGPHKDAFEKHMKKVKSQTRRKSDLDAAQKQINDEYARIYRSVTDAVIFALDLSLFGLLTNREGVLTGSHLITYDGIHWNETRLAEDSLRMRTVNKTLTGQYRLVKANAKDTFKIVTDPARTLVFDAQTARPEELHLVTPYYAQAQPRGKPVRLYVFGSDQPSRELPASEKLNSVSNQMAIVTNEHTNRTARAIVFRCVKYFLSPNVTVLGQQSLRASATGESAIVTGYQYDVRDLQLSVDGIMFRRIQVVPGASTSRFGWYEQSIDLQSGQTKRRAFAANGRPVIDSKLREQERKQRESEQSSGMKASDAEKMILDIGGRMQIVDLGPYRLQDEMVSYYGFESYEANHFGKENKWVFDKKLIAGELHNRYLHMSQQMHTLTGQFMPLEPFQSFVVSCWMRTAAQPKVGDHLDTLTVDVLVDQAGGKKIRSNATTEVKQRIGDWSYVETIVDTTDVPRPAKLIFAIIVAPSSAHPTLDVDHIRFSPLGLRFEANIYDPTTGDLHAVLGDNGLLKSYLYTPKGKQAVIFTEHGEVQEFTMQSKVMYTRIVPGAKPSVVDIKPRRSLYNRFDQATTSWHRTSRGWEAHDGAVAFEPHQPGASIEKAFPGTWKSLALRFLYNLPSADIRMKLIWRKKEFHLPCGASAQCPPIPADGEILVFITAQHISIWVEGVLVQEARLADGDVSAAEPVFRVDVSGSFEISEFIEMFDSSIKVTYQNHAGQPTQMIVYEGPETVRLREIHYDSIERPVLQTKWTKIQRKDGEGFFAFHDDFITGFDNETLLMNGTVADLNPACEGYPYSYTIYDSDPTENKRLQGLPGKLYGIRGKYRRAYSSSADSVLLNNLFPSGDGFNQKTTIHPGGAVRVIVEDDRGNKVAKYSKVGNYEHRLSTFRYAVNSSLLEQELPPMYHTIAGTSSMVDFSADSQSKLQQLQAQWEVRYAYDEQNRVTRKRTPDGGIYQYLYDRYGILRFSLHKDANGTLDRVLHFMYAPDGKISREALVKLNETECTTLLDAGKVPESTDFIDTIYGAHEADPNLRYRIKFASRRIDEDQMTEYLLHDQRDQLLKKTFVVNTINTSYSIDYEYENDKLRSIKYPIGRGDKPFKLIFDYNGHGEITSARESSERDPWFEYTYNADGVVETMKLRAGLADSFIQRNFSYNEPGFLVRLADDYLTEDVSYLETDSYGQDSYTPIYEGLISQTVFTAHWQRSASSLRMGLYPEDFISSGIDRKQADICFDMLKEKGYLNEVNQVNRTFYGERDDDLPFVCGEEIPMNHLSAVLSTGSFAHQYGHRYDYDDHDQLIKAKYFHGPDELSTLKPLTHATFANEIVGVAECVSKKMWDVLVLEGFLSVDCTNPNLCHGRPGTRSMFHEVIRKHRYQKHLKAMLSKAIAGRRGLSGDEFDARCKRWIAGSNLAKSTCANIKSSLAKFNFLGDRPENPLASLSSEFKIVLKEFENKLPDIVRVLSKYFTTELGRSAGDVQSYEIDANGNHRKFYTGFSRYRLEYREGTNQITKVHRMCFDREQQEEEHFNMEHNSDGGVVKAEHKGIKRMEYDPILHRVTKVEMQDGRKLIYQYDVRAERTFKQVLNPDGTVSHEKYYIRDTHGSVLADMEMTYLAKDQPPDVRVTSYIYKDQQLVGFVRNDKLYGVISDHEGSVRLVVRNGEVLAAYDYLPYGQIFRRYGTDLDAQLSYLYTGQEWEPETGLYNYRARLYDPDIGRFYQMDPKEQYPSPYVYAGNSPVSLVDPDGEFAFALACLILSLIGAYLGAASSAKSWNPLQWNWKSKSLWLGMICGALTGLSIPFNMTASVSYFVGMGLSLTASIAIMVGSGITFGYFALAAVSGSWDPTNFDFTSPALWNALLGGIATSAFIVTHPNSMLTTFRAITTTLGRALFVTTTVALSVTFAYLFGVSKMGGEFNVAKWDFSNPALYYSILDGLTTTSFAMSVVSNIPKTVIKWNKKLESSLDRLAEVEIFFRARNLMRGDWSMKLSNVRYFITANAQSIARLQRGILPIAFYTFILSLRVADAYQTSPVPGFSVFMQILSTVVTTRGFSNRVVKPLVPKVANVPLALRSSNGPAGWEGSSSSAGTPTSFFNRFHLPALLEWFRFTRFTTARMEGSDDTAENDLGHERRTQQSQTSKPGTTVIENCYRVTAAESSGGYYVKCYAIDSITTIFPKVDAALDSGGDTYRRCLPVTVDGAPGTSCDGERSSLLSTVIEAPKLMDYVDSWLLLARVAPAAIREARRIFGCVFRRQSADPIDPPALRKAHVDVMMAGLVRLETLSQRLPDEWPAMGRWVGPMVDDVRADVHEYLAHGRGNRAVLLERLDALESDIWEEVELRRAKQFVPHVHAQMAPSMAPLEYAAAGGACSSDDLLWTRLGSLHNDLSTTLLSSERH